MNQTIKVLIDNMGSSGEGVGRHEGLTIFVEGALPGEEVQAQLFKKEKRYAKGKLLQIDRPSLHRVEPPCQYFDRCGGCQIMHLDYAEQLRMKRQRVIDALTRIGKIDCEVSPCLPSPNELGYRNKVQAQVQKDRFGFYARMSHDLVEVDTCKLHHPIGDRVYQNVIKILKTNRFYPRHLLLKSSLTQKEVLIVLVTMEDCAQIAQKLMQIEGVAGVVQNLNDGDDNVVLGKEFRLIAGRDHILEEICGLTFKISPASFFQVNPLQAENLYREALRLAHLTGEEVVLDAYCGVGTMSLLFAKDAKKVIGVECVGEAIVDARENAQRNGITNVEFHCGESERFIEQVEKVDVILLNPPRKGCEKSFLEGVMRLKPKKVIYVSCDPATLARDLALLTSYKVETVQPFDMFPQTAHAETLVSLCL